MAKGGYASREPSLGGTGDHSVPIESERRLYFYSDAFSSREPVSKTLCRASQMSNL
jgi:hypothetical protein